MHTNIRVSVQETESNADFKHKRTKRRPKTKRTTNGQDRRGAGPPSSFPSSSFCVEIKTSRRVTNFRPLFFRLLSCYVLCFLSLFRPRSTKHPKPRKQVDGEGEDRRTEKTRFMCRRQRSFFHSFQMKRRNKS